MANPVKPLNSKAMAMLSKPSATKGTPVKGKPSGPATPNPFASLAGRC